VHGPGYSGAEGISGTATLPSGAFADGFHVYGVDWRPGSISWTVDGTTYRTVTPADLGGDRWVFDKPFFVILNVAVGGDWPGAPDRSSRFPQQMLVDWVRVWQNA
jgi:beta-glucanase (GH16 family)